MSAFGWAVLAVAAALGCLALLALLQILVALLAWGGRVRRWNPSVDRAPLADGREVAAERIRSPPPVDLEVAADPSPRRRAASFVGPELPLADTLAAAAWGAAVYGLVGSLVLAPAAGWMGLAVVGFVVGALGVGLVSPASRPSAHSSGVRAGLFAGVTGGTLAALAGTGGLVRLLEPLGPAVWMLFLVTCVAGGAALGAVLAVRGVIAPLRLAREWVALRDGSWSWTRAANALAAGSLWLGAGFALLAMTTAAAILWIGRLWN